jgi:hypothetical protein
VLVQEHTEGDLAATGQLADVVGVLGARAKPLRQRSDLEADGAAGLLDAKDGPVAG